MVSKPVIPATLFLVTVDVEFSDPLFVVAAAGALAFRRGAAGGESRPKKREFADDILRDFCSDGI